jgi:DNA helicase-2/ATP-dependent DNA helicase PcrA
LADLDQRIYEFRGADPARVSEFIERFSPAQFDFGKENNRSNGTDIVQFGNDLLTGKNKGTAYNDVHVKGYAIRKGTGAHLTVKAEVIQAVKRLSKSEQPNWSVGLLVPSKKLMLAVSDFLATKQTLAGRNYLPELSHDVALEMTGPSLAAVLISRLMEKGSTDLEIQHSLLNSICEHIRGRNGNDQPSQSHLNLTYSLKEFMATGKIRGSSRQLVVNEASRIGCACRTLKFSGDPAADWLTVRRLLEVSPCDAIKQAAIDAKYLRLLRKGAILNSGLSTLWRTKANYEGASGIVRNALAQEHFSASLTVWKGIHVMTIHKAKGKEFDEVIIYEGMYNGRIVWAEPRTKEYEQSRLALRVAVTRAMKRVTIITPRMNRCPFL